MIDCIRANYEIFGPIIGFFAVQMMDLSAFWQLSAQRTLHNVDMLVYKHAFNANSPIAIRQNVSRAFRCDPLLAI
jgi:hypothetical protein